MDKKDTNKKFKPTKAIFDSNYESNRTVNLMGTFQIICIILTAIICTYYIYNLIQLGDVNFNYKTGVKTFDGEFNDLLDNLTSYIRNSYIINIITSIILCIVFCLICGSIKSNANHLLGIDVSVFEDTVIFEQEDVDKNSNTTKDTEEN